MPDERPLVQPMVLFTVIRQKERRGWARTSEGRRKKRGYVDLRYVVRERYRH